MEGFIYVHICICKNICFCLYLYMHFTHSPMISCNFFQVVNIYSISHFLCCQNLPQYSKLRTAGASGWLSWLSVQLWISAQVKISWLMGWSPVSASTLTAQNLLGILSLPLSLCPSPTHVCALSLSLSQNK